MSIFTEVTVINNMDPRDSSVSKVEKRVCIAEVMK